jgi:hypothetical protein
MIGAVITLAGLGAFIMLIVGGFMYLMSGGEKEATQKAQKTLTYAIGGLVVTLSAWIIMNFVGNFLGINLATFNICLPGFGRGGGLVPGTLSTFCI